jgi:hypothetical protein
MGKTSIFGRRSSKAASDGCSPTISQGSGGGERKKKGVGAGGGEKSQPRVDSAPQGQRSKTPSDKKKETPKVDRRKTKDRAKQMSENKNSARRMKKRDEVRSLVHRLPGEVRSSRSSGTGDPYGSTGGGS